MAVKQPIVMQQRGTHRRGEVEISGKIVVGAAGAVTSFQCEAIGTGGLVKNAAAGRYDMVFLRKYKNVRLSSITINNIAGGAFGNTNANMGQWRTPTATFHATIQMLLASTGADTDVASTNEIHFGVVVQET
jgi:hypothetical protein